MINPQIVKVFIDSSSLNNTNLLVDIALLFIFNILFRSGFSVLLTWIGTNIGWLSTNLLRQDLLEHCLHLGLSFHAKKTPGELIETIDGDVTILAGFFTQFAQNLVANMLLILFVLVAYFFINIFLGLIFTIYIVTTFFVLFLAKDITIPHQIALRQTSADMYSFIEDRIGGIEDISSNNAGPSIIKEFDLLNSKDLKAKSRQWFWNSFYVAVILLMLALGALLALTTGGILYYQKDISLGTVYLILNYITLLYLPLEVVTNNFQELQRIGVSVARINALFAIHPIIKPAIEEVFLLETAPTLSFDNVSFMYDFYGRNVLENITFTIYPHQILGLIGRTGSGKTTLARLLFRFYDPTQGNIYLNGLDLCDINPYSLRRSIGYVTQDIQLFHASVRDNITFFDKNIRDETIISTLETLELSNWLYSLENGLDTILGSESRGVSGGQAQLIALARVFLKEAKIIILDEASSQLDPVTEKFIERALDMLIKKATVLIITHHLSILQKVDQILILDNGHISEFGDKYSLQQNTKSKFYQIMQTGLHDTWI